jgi:hypothetical protein
MGLLCASIFYKWSRPVTEFIDPAFAETSPNRSFSLTENERFGLVFSKTGSKNSGTGNSEFFKISALRNTQAL